MVKVKNVRWTTISYKNWKWSKKSKIWWNKKYFKNKEEGLILGGIKNSGDFFDEAPENLKNLYFFTENGKDKIQKEMPFIFGINEILSEYPHIGIFGGSELWKIFFD